MKKKLNLNRETVRMLQAPLSRVAGGATLLDSNCAACHPTQIQGGCWNTPNCPQ